MAPDSTMPRPLAVGVGNPLRGDDAAGLEALRLLHDAAPPNVDFVAVEGEASALMEAWSGRERVYAIDASSSGAEPGAVRRFDASADDLPSEFLHCSTHSFGLAEAIGLARAMGELPPTVVVYAVEGVWFEPGRPLSEAAARGAREAARALLAELAGTPPLEPRKNGE